MSKIKSLIWLIILMNILNCGKNNINNDKTYLYVASDNGLVLREKPSRQSTKVIVLPFNSRIQLINDNGPYETINNKSNKWIKIKFNNYSGWVFSEYVSKNRTPAHINNDEKSFKYTTWSSQAGGYMSGASLTFDSFNYFELSTGCHDATLYGEWRINKDNVILKFHCKNKSKCDYSDLIFNEKGKKYYENDNVTMLSKNIFSFNKNVNIIYFCGVSLVKPDSIKQNRK